MSDFLEKSELILDSTGPGIISHFPELRKLGLQRLLEFQRVHAFSGGIFAYLSFYALAKNHLRYEIELYEKELDLFFLRAHNPSFFSVGKTVFKLLQGKAPFKVACLENHIKYVFADDFLNQKVSRLPENFTPYVSIDDSCQALLAGQLS